jgi:hypothetical protein
MATALRVQPLLTNEIADNGGYTHRAMITADDLTVTTTNTAQTFQFDLAAGDTIHKVAWRAETFLKDASDAAYNSNTMSVGDDSSVTTYIAAIQLNENGTEVRQGLTNTAVTYTAPDHFKITINSMSAKALNDIDTGQVVIFFQLSRLATLTNAVVHAVVTTK